MTISQMLAEKHIGVPNYQRAYSWDTEQDPAKTPKQVNEFLKDLQDYVRSKSSSHYYFGHFLLEKLEQENEYGVIDGQQRLTTIIIFIAAMFRKLERLRSLTGKERQIYANVVKVDGEYTFSTVDYDDHFFRQYVIDSTRQDRNGLATMSQRRIADAYDYFCRQADGMSEADVCNLIATVAQATCTTHVVENEAEAIQMFIFQNNRGKRPTNLEIIKAQFMYNVHLHGGEDKDKLALLNDIRESFEEIYKSIARIEDRIDEDDVLIAEGLEIDPEYTYTGSNADARRYLDSYRVWNYVEEGDVKVENGLLSVFNVGELHDEDDFDDRLPVLVYSMRSALVPLSVYEGAPYGLGFGKLCRHMGVEL